MHDRRPRTCLSLDDIEALRDFRADGQCGHVHVSNLLALLRLGLVERCSEEGSLFRGAFRLSEKGRRLASRISPTPPGARWA